MQRFVLEVVGGRLEGKVAGRRAVWPGEVADVVRSGVGRERGEGVVALAGWPLGQGKRMVRAIECSSAVKDGAWGVVVVPEAGLVVRAGVEALRDELTELARAARAASPEVWLGLGVSRWAVVSLGGVAAWGALRWESLERAARESGMDDLVEVCEREGA